MQSQLEAALLGLGSCFNTNLFEEYKKHQDDEVDDAEPAEECTQGNINYATSKSSAAGRNVTLQTLLDVGILQPGVGVMTIEYLGQKFVGDLTQDGKILCQETGGQFVSPSAWTVACKQFINPEKKFGSGWSTVKYKGKKLDVFKNIFFQRRKESQQENNTNKETKMSNITMQRIVVKHNTIANRTFTHDANTMVECVPFSNLGKIQPFLISLSTNAAFIMDFHCHLTKSEVSGYLAGHWDLNSHNLQVTHAFPCRNTKRERELAPQVEAEIARTIEREKLTLVGWYHSHPFAAAAPTLRDIDAQLDYQIRMKGFSDNSYTPCIGVILSPYNFDNTSLESSIICYWVIPPPEAKPNEYGRPMLMSYSVSQDQTMPSLQKDELTKCVDYYKKELDFMNFSDKFYGSTTFGDKLRTSLTSKFPSEQKDTLWGHIKGLLGITSEDKEHVLSIPSVSKSSQMLMNMSSALNPNLMLTSDIANALFSSGKFPSATSLLGLPDPMAHSTLAANNMFLQSNLFKMQELLKPLSTSSPLTSSSTSSKSKSSSSHLKIPSEVKTPKLDFPTDLNILALKSKLEFPQTQKGEYSLGELSNLSNSLLALSKEYGKDFPMLSKDYLTTTQSKDYSVATSKEYNPSDYSSSTNKLEYSVASASDYSTPKDFSSSSNKDFSVADLSKSANSDYSLNLSKSDASEPPSKIAKTDYSLDLSQRGYLPPYPSSNEGTNRPNNESSQQQDDQPLNLHSDSK